MTDLTYAGSFRDPFRRTGVRALEWGTLAAPRLLWTARRLRGSTAEGLDLIDAVTEALRLKISAEGAQVPVAGPLVVVANHPTGLVDGLALSAALRARRDQKILARGLFDGIAALDSVLIPVPFPDAPDAVDASRAARAAAQAHLRRGGTLVLFPAGKVAQAPQWSARPVEGAWSASAVQLARRAGAPLMAARITPCRGPGRRWHPDGATWAQGLRLRDIARQIGAGVTVHLHPPLDAHAASPTELMARLRALALTSPSG